jgi:hypothetical protein
MDTFSTNSASGRFFHALFAITCIQNSKTTVMVMLALTWTSVQALGSYVNMSCESREIVRLREATSPRAAAGCSQEEACQSCNNVATRVLLLLEQDEIASLLFECNHVVYASSFYRYYSSKWTARHRELLRQRQDFFQGPPPPSRRSSSKVRQLRASIGLAIQKTCRLSTAISGSIAIARKMVRRRTRVVPIAQQSTAIETIEALQVTEVQKVIASLHKNEMQLLHSYTSAMVYLLYGKGCLRPCLVF